MKGRTSELARRIESKYGKTEIGQTYEIDGKKYKLTDGNVDFVFKKVEDFKDRIIKLF